MQEPGRKEKSTRAKIRKEAQKTRYATGKVLLEMVENNGWHILNGNVEGNENGEYTFIRSTGQSVIDYTIVDTDWIQ